MLTLNQERLTFGEVKQRRKAWEELIGISGMRLKRLGLVTVALLLPSWAAQSESYGVDQVEVMNVLK